MRFGLPTNIRQLMTDIKYLNSVRTKKALNSLRLYEYPFDLQLLSQSKLYQKSRAQYLALGGRFSARVSSTMRSLSTQDIFIHEIDYSPIEKELLWFTEYNYLLTEAEVKTEYLALTRFNDISIFHEQNHRIVWPLLPPAPQNKRDLCRYLNFAESLVVMLDLALADEIGLKHSKIFNRMNLIHRPAVKLTKTIQSQKEYRRYLLAIFCATYLILEFIHKDDLLKALNYILPEQKSINKTALKRSLELNDNFTKVTNPQWQQMYWKKARMQLNKIHLKKREHCLILPNNPLDLEVEFTIVGRVLNIFGI